jgi:hypothetical protein
VQHHERERGGREREGGKREREGEKMPTDKQPSLPRRDCGLPVLVGKSGEQTRVTDWLRINWKDLSYLATCALITK